jgi:hypothetical protein
VTFNQFQPPASPPHDVLRSQTTTAPGSLLLRPSLTSATIWLHAEREQ